MRFVLIDDKEFAPPKAVKSMQSFYRSAQTELKIIDAKTVSKRGLGHFGFFRQAYQQSLWPDVIAWIELN